MSSLPMTDAEIEVSYLQAKMKSRQIKILSQLCVTTPDEIKAALERRGVSISRKRPPGRLPTVDYARVDELYCQGLYDAEIANRLGIAPSTVANWRKNNDLPSNFKQGVRRPKGVTA